MAKDASRQLQLVERPAHGHQADSCKAGKFVAWGKLIAGAKTPFSDQGLNEIHDLPVTQDRALSLGRYTPAQRRTVPQPAHLSHTPGLCIGSLLTSRRLRQAPRALLPA